MEIISKDIITEGGESEFELRFIKKEGVGLLTTQSGKNYLILDSIDFWYDLIQSKYPNKIKCKCKSEWFSIRFDYIPRKDTKDVKQVNIISKCKSCFAEAKQMSVGINYSPTNSIVNEPLTICEYPILKYDLKEISCYWTQVDLKNFLAFMAAELNFGIYCWYWQNSDNKRHLGKVSLDKAFEIITVDHRYLDFYFSPVEPDFKVRSTEGGIYIEGDPWRQEELVQLSSPNVIALGPGQKGLLYYLHFSKEYINNGIVVRKSDNFNKTSEKLITWLKNNYIEVRGIDCFDNPDEHKRLFGNKFLKETRN